MEVRFYWLMFRFALSRHTRVATTVLNKNGLRTAPCGTPLTKLESGEVAPWKHTLARLFHR